MTIQVGDIVRQYVTPVRILWDDAKVTYVHGNGALDVRDMKTGACYGWTERRCEVISRVQMQEPK